MLERQHKPTTIVQKIYTRCSNKYEEITDSPHSQLKNDQKMVFGFGGGIMGIALSYFSIMSILSFSPTMILGIIGLVMSVQLLRFSNNFVKGSQN